MLSNNFLVQELIEHIGHDGPKVCADDCFYAIELISICDRICWDVFYSVEFFQGFMPTISIHGNCHQALRTQKFSYNMHKCCMILNVWYISTVHLIEAKLILMLL